MKSMTLKRGIVVRAALLIAAVLVVAAASVQPAYTDENINVSCYKGDKDGGDYLGTVMAFSPAAAASQCNALYFACKGKCYGRFSDFDLGGDVCYDSSGREFLR